MYTTQALDICISSILIKCPLVCTKHDGSYTAQPNDFKSELCITSVCTYALPLLLVRAPQWLLKYKLCMTPAYIAQGCVLKILIFSG